MLGLLAVMAPPLPALPLAALRLLCPLPGCLPLLGTASHMLPQHHQRHAANVVETTVGERPRTRLPGSLEIVDPIGHRDDA